MTCENTMDSALLEAWFERFLLPALKEPSVIIMDNARFHRMAVLRGMVRKGKHMILPFPPYSPEPDPIEKVWANIKRELRKAASEHACLSEMLSGVSYFS